VGADPLAARAHRRAGWRVVRHAMGVRKRSYWGGGAGWLVFFVAPVAVGLLLEALFDAIVDGGPAMAFVAAVAGIELGRAALLPVTMWVFEPFIGTTATVLRTNVLRAQLEPDPDQRGPVIEDPAGALPLFREDPEHVAMAADQWINVVGAAAVALGALVVIARIGPGVALAVAAPLVLAAIAGSLFAPVVRRRREQDRAVTAEVTGELGEMVAAAVSVTTAGAVPAVLRRFERLCERRRVTAVRDRVARQLLPAVAGGAGDLALAGGLLVAAVALADELTAGQVALLASYATMLAIVPRYWAQWLTTRRHADVAVARLRATVRDGEVDRLLAPVAPVRVHPGPVLRRPVPTPPAAPSLSLCGLVAVAPDGRHIGPVHAEIPAGGLAVVTGPVGSGKTTLLRAVLGLLPLAGGEVRWDGGVVDPPRWMVPPRASYVAQVPVLFSERLDDNLRLGWEVDDDGLRRAMHTAAVADLLGSLEDGFATRLGPRGVRLSGGQAHRVAAARALVPGPALLVADDLSAALDAETETRLLDRILADRTRTLLLVSHRPAVLQRADVVIDLGGQQLA
jgi:ATP-binding cassette, subfamily B, bacterial